MTRQAESAARLLAKYGEPVSLAFPDYSGTDPVTGEPIGDAEDVVISGNGYPSNYLKKDIDGTVIRAGDIRLILELVETRPIVGCMATVDSVTYRVMDVQPIRLSGDDVIYICQLRAN